MGSHWKWTHYNLFTESQGRGNVRESARRNKEEKKAEKERQIGSVLVCCPSFGLSFWMDPLQSIFRVWKWVERVYIFDSVATSLHVQI